MSKRDELINKYAADLKEKCGIAADMNLLTKVTASCGPAIYRDDAATVSVSDKKEVDRIKTNYTNVDFPSGAYCDEPITSVTGSLTLKVEIPRPKTVFGTGWSPRIYRSSPPGESTPTSGRRCRVCGRRG